MREFVVRQHFLPDDVFFDVLEDTVWFVEV